MTARRMRIAHVIHSLGAGGAEAVLTELVTPAREAGMDLLVVGLSDAEDDRAAVSLRAVGAPVHELHAGRYDLRAAVAVREVLLREHVDLVHTHLKHADVIGGLAARRAGLPAVSTLHLIEAEPSGWVDRARVRTAVLARNRLFQRVIVLSRAQRDWYGELSRGAPIRLIPNGVRPPRSLEDPTRVRTRLRVRRDEVLAVTVSLMRPEKGHADLLAALRRVGHDVVVALAGDGPLLSDTRAAVAADPVLRRRVRVLGFRDDVDDLLSAADFVVHPSRADALPTALISALAAGRPVVATRVGGIPDIVTRDCGVLVPSGDVAALAAAIDGVAADQARRKQMSTAALARYQAEFSADVWADRLATTYRELLQLPTT